MSSESALWFVSSLLTYAVRSTAAYLLLWLFCRPVWNPRIRFWLYGLFLVGAVAAWLQLFVPSLDATPVLGSTVFNTASAKYWSWSLNPTFLPYLTKALLRAIWAYGIILALLLAWFCVRFWQLKTFLRASKQAPDSLSLLFGLLRRKTGAPSCELQLVTDLRSPATVGWWHPKVLLPHDLLPRLGTQQLAHILRHELVHVRRRDYLWDRLSTLGCYVIFFHPAAWLARRHLRWERELACDDGVVQRSRKSRLEYASCLTTLANWWFLEEKVTGQVDFLSSPPSLLAARVRALVTQPLTYDSSKAPASTMLASVALTVAVLLLPQITVSSYNRGAAADSQPRVLPRTRRPATARTGRAQLSKRRTSVASALPPIFFAPHMASPDLSYQVNLPDLLQPTNTIDLQPDASAFLAESTEEARTDGTIWNESPPRPPRRRVAKIGSVALQAMKLAVSVAAVQIVDHGHEKAR
jgi:beta-lactamase regulating signal transducer with metallopeptidase domain